MCTFLLLAAAEYDAITESLTQENVISGYLSFFQPFVFLHCFSSRYHFVFQFTANFTAMYRPRYFKHVCWLWFASLYSNLPQIFCLFMIVYISERKNHDSRQAMIRPGSHDNSGNLNMKWVYRRNTFWEERLAYRRSTFWDNQNKQKIWLLCDN